MENGENARKFWQEISNPRTNPTGLLMSEFISMQAMPFSMFMMVMQFAEEFAKLQTAEAIIRYDKQVKSDHDRHHS